MPAAIDGATMKYRSLLHKHRLVAKLLRRYDVQTTTLTVVAETLQYKLLINLYADKITNKNEFLMFKLYC